MHPRFLQIWSTLSHMIVWVFCCEYIYIYRHIWEGKQCLKKKVEKTTSYINMNTQSEGHMSCAQGNKERR